MCSEVLVKISKDDYNSSLQQELYKMVGIHEIPKEASIFIFSLSFQVQSYITYL